MPVTSRLLAAGFSDVGRQRRENEDRIHVDAEGGIFLVVDGLGGHAAGERAAEIAVSMITTRLARHTGTTEERVREAFALANNEIHELGTRHAEWEGMASVATLALVEEDQVTVGHVGDSRLYLLEPGSIRKITRDHSPVGEQEDAGELTEAAAMAHSRRNEVFRDLGSESHTPNDKEFVDIHRFRLKRADGLLLCSDGLTDQLTSEEIRRTVEKHAGNPEAAVRDLIAAANAAGGKDNVSVILVETGGYRAASVPTIPQPERRSGWPAAIWFLLGLAAATALLFAIRPHLIETTAGRSLGFGNVRAPLTWQVGANGIPTITDAIAQARDGDTVLVSPGVYHENVRLKSGVSVISVQRNAARLNAPGIVVEADNIQRARLSGFEIVGPADVGVRIINSGIEVTNLKISGMNEAGVEIDEASRPLLAASTINNNPGTGIYIHGAARPEIRHNVISGNGRSPGKPRPGIHIAGTAVPQIIGNIIAENGVEQIWASPLFNAEGLFSQNAIAGGVKDRARQWKVVTR
ncbi:MAG TPA: protein phosphatase 2C domain-containing protein [Bryobacteraceae bacterium]|nr:protein phosphatase 2C domain-containing protein [Bryobacteraceae bacterium]